ncbi:MAG: nitrous oxide reductase accessory protein NosL [Rhodobacterales bacterium]
MKYILLLTVVLLAGCRHDEAATKPDPQNITGESSAYFCQMSLVEMPGPKGQIFLEGMPGPLFFGQVRDAIAYLKDPEKIADILAFYVNDMGRAPSWESPGKDNWIDGYKAFYVVGAGVTGGMGAPELAPFSTKAAAQEFARENGGKTMQLEAIPDTAVLGGVEHPTIGD